MTGRGPLPRHKPPARLLRRWSGAWRRWSLWALLATLMASLLVTLAWLARRYEASQVQERLERDAGDALADIRGTLQRNLRDLRALPRLPERPQVWQEAAGGLLSRQRELMRLEWRDGQLRPLAHALSPWQSLPEAAHERSAVHSEMVLACTNARRLMAPSYSSSYYHGLAGGSGSELMELCVPLFEAGQVRGYLVATYLLQTLLADVVGPGLQRTQEASFTEADGTRLALVGAPQRRARVFSAQQLLDLPGNTLVLRLSAWHGAPALFPNVLSALVTTISVLLLFVLVVLVRDTRRRLRAERELAEALAFRKAMEDSLVTGLRARDLQGHITYVNPAFCAMVGFSAAELVGRELPLPYWPPELAEEYARGQQHRLAAPPLPERGHESLFMRRDGTRFPVMIYEAPLINAQGVHAGWMGSIVDVSEQRHAEELSRTTHERLQATARLATAGEMASLLSHELNQPLSAIASYATGSLNLLAAVPGGGPPAPAWELAEVREAVQRIARQAERAGRVIKSVHDFVRRRPHVREVVPVAELFEAVLPLVRLQARKLDVQVTLDLPPDLPPALCDRTMVEQVLLNLTRNAMQAMDEDAAPGPRVLELRARRMQPQRSAQAWVKFEVADNGSGIAPEVAARLFTPLFTTRAEGMGLGLSLCRTVVEQHGGTLSFTAREPRGTVFGFTLPAAASPE
ncbi:ATP-binding protein [Melaminivora sp.]|uniref:two-component system sensor histidine kinase NtrB n=1 Tax=Melaminivora sp. TaxID=1933032 RepID=UPI0028AA4056|nr:ATP-binding protein [Melaminivora sp.]